MPRKNKRKFFGKNKNKSAKLNQNAVETSTVSSEQEQSDSEDATAENCDLVSSDSSAAMGQVESTAEVNTETVKDIDPPQKATITLKVITQFIGDVPKETRGDESVQIADEDSKINDNDGKFASEASPLLLHNVGAVPKLNHNKEYVKSRHQRSFDDNYRVESPKHICIERNQTPSKRHAMLIQEISESSSSEEVKQFLHLESAMRIDKVENSVSPKDYRVESPASSDENSVQNMASDVMVQEISESSSSESVKNEILASMATPPPLKFEPQNNSKIINIKELPSESTVVTSSAIKFESKTEKKLNKAEEAILEALYGNKNLLTIPNLPLDVISEEGSDCGSDIDKQAKRIADELDDDVFLPGVIKKPPLKFRRQQVAEQPQLLNAKIIETESNIQEGCKSWEMSQSDSELQAELVYLTSASSSATDLSERDGDVTDTDVEDTSEDTETNSLLENISVPSFDFDMPIEMKISQKSTVFSSEYFHDNINEQKLPDILEEDEERSLDIIESQQQIENVNKELHHLVNEHEVIQTREKTVEPAMEEELVSASQEKENLGEECQVKRRKFQVDALELQLEEMQSQVTEIESSRSSRVEEFEIEDLRSQAEIIDGYESQAEIVDDHESQVDVEVKSELDQVDSNERIMIVKSQVREMKSHAEELESQLEEIKNQVGEIKSLLEDSEAKKETFTYDTQVNKPLEDYEGQVIEIVDFQSRVIFPTQDETTQLEGQVEGSNDKSQNQDLRRESQVCLKESQEYLMGSEVNLQNNQEDLHERQVNSDQCLESSYQNQESLHQSRVRPIESQVILPQSKIDLLEIREKLKFYKNIHQNELRIDENDDEIYLRSTKSEKTLLRAFEQLSEISNQTTIQVKQDSNEAKEQEETLNIVREVISDVTSDKQKIVQDNDKARDDNSNRVTPTQPFKRKNSTDSSSSANSQCTIIRQIADHVDPLQDLCMQSLNKIGFTHDDRDAKITIYKKLNSFSRNAPQIPIMNELELHFKNNDDNLEGRENRVITILQVPPEINRATSAPSNAWRGLPSTQIPNLMIAFSPLQQSYMNSQDSNTSADVLLDMHKKFVERRAYHESSESEVVENSSNVYSREVFFANESQMESGNQLEDGYFGDRESSVENLISKSSKANNSPETVSNLSEPVANCDNEAVSSRPSEKSAEIECRMNAIRNCLLRDEFFRSAFSGVKRDSTDDPPTSDEFPPLESFETKKFELENELKSLDNERHELEEELKNLRSLQHFKREEFLHNEKKLQSLESQHSSLKSNDFTEFINSNEILQQELYNEWQDKVLERYERKLSKTIKITSISESDNHLERAASEALKTLPIESEFMTKLKERRQRLSLPNETELNSSTESLHHQNEEIKNSTSKPTNIPAHLYEFLKYYEEETTLGKNSDESGESNNVNPLLIGLIGVSMCLCGFYIGRYFITHKSNLF